jgi:linoleoyl-CoA desaturase
MLTHPVLLPLLFVDAPAWLILSGCVAGHLACGLFIGIVFQTTHLFEGTRFGRRGASHVEHVFATTSDFAPGSRIVTWITGGLNIHVAHHLLPGVSHLHLPALARIIEELACAHGLPCRKETVLGAPRSHLRLLAALGRGTYQTSSCPAGAPPAAPTPAP